MFRNHTSWCENVQLVCIVLYALYKGRMVELPDPDATSSEPPAQRQKLESTATTRGAALSEAADRLRASLAFSHNAQFDEEDADELLGEGDADLHDTLAIKHLDAEQHELVRRAIVKGGFSDDDRLAFHASVRADFAQLMQHGRDASVKNSTVLQIGYSECDYSVAPSNRST